MVVDQNSNDRLEEVERGSTVPMTNVNLRITHAAYLWRFVWHLEGNTGVSGGREGGGGRVLAGVLNLTIRSYLWGIVLVWRKSRWWCRVGHSWLVCSAFTFQEHFVPAIDEMSMAKVDENTVRFEFYSRVYWITQAFTMRNAVTRWELTNQTKTSENFYVNWW